MKKSVAFIGLEQNTKMKQLNFGVTGGEPIGYLILCFFLRQGDEFSRPIGR